MTSEAIAITYGLSSAITWGAGDFSGGWASRRNSVLTVILVSQVIGALALMALGFLFSEPLPATPTLVWGGVAGICGVIGLMAFYKGLASGRMGVVAPLSAVLTAVLPVCFALFTEGLPSLTQISGFAVALLAVWFLSAPESNSLATAPEWSLASVRESLTVSRATPAETGPAWCACACRFTLDRFQPAQQGEHSGAGRADAGLGQVFLGEGRPRDVHVQPGEISGDELSEEQSRGDCATPALSEVAQVRRPLLQLIQVLVV